MAVERDPFGRAHRVGRLSDTETAEWMMTAAIRKVDEGGLPVSFDLLRFEELIVDAGVARSAVYRRWPTKHHFYADLLRELAGRAHPAVAAYEQTTVATAIRLGTENLEQLKTPEGRHRMAVEMCRQAALENFRTLSGSRSWSLYVTLNATMLSLPPEGGLLGDLERSLSQSWARYFTRMGSIYAGLLGLVGYRVRTDITGLSEVTLAELGAALIEGLSLNSIGDAGGAAKRFTGDPFHTGEQAEWSLAGLGFASQLMALVEPDPAAGGDWDDAELDRRAQALQATP